MSKQLISSYEEDGIEYTTIDKANFAVVMGYNLKPLVLYEYQGHFEWHNANLLPTDNIHYKSIVIACDIMKNKELGYNFYYFGTLTDLLRFLYKKKI